jgi:hypothetical protein
VSSGKTEEVIAARQESGIGRRHARAGATPWRSSGVMSIGSVAVTMLFSWLSTHNGLPFGTGALSGGVHVRCRHDWHLRAFLWNVGVYDSLICSQPINGDQVEEMLIREMGRTDTVFTHAAFLEGLECQAEIDAGGFNIRHLAHQEIHEVFAGRSGLDRCYTESAIQEALGAEWFAVVRGPARPFEDRIVFEDDAIGLHDFTCTAFRDINLGLNLFKAAPGPVVIRQTFHWNSSLFHRRVREYPRQSNDLFPSSWGGSPMRLCRLNADDGHRLPLFWNDFKKT